MDELTICRCEEISRTEIVDAIAAGADSVSWIKRMTRAGMGTCQGRTCGKMVARILQEEMGFSPDTVFPDSPRSPLRPVALGLIADTYDPEGPKYSSSVSEQACDPIFCDLSGQPKPEIKERNFDVIIIGGGSTGAATAYYLAKAGVQVAVVEKKQIASEGGGRNMGGIRQLGRHPYEMKMSLDSIRDYDTLDQELDTDIEYRKMGYLWLALDEEEWAQQQRIIVSQKEAGANLFLMQRQEVLNKFPAVSDLVVGGIYSPDDGQASPMKVTRGYAHAAEKLGAKLYTNTTVNSFIISGGKVIGLNTDRGEIYAPTVLVATGPWSIAFGRMVGMELPIRCVPNQFMVTEPLPALVSPLVLTSGGVCLQGVNGNMYVGNANPPEDVQGLDERTNFSEMGRTARNMLKVVPALRNAKVIRTWAGILDHTPDDIPIMGPAPDVEGLYFACGYSGHGFALAPQLGKILTEMLISGRTPQVLENFSFERFSHPEELNVAEHFTHQVVHG